MDADDVAADVAASADLVFEIAEELDDEGADESGQTEPTAYEDSPPSRFVAEDHKAQQVMSPRLSPSLPSGSSKSSIAPLSFPAAGATQTACTSTTLHGLECTSIPSSRRSSGYRQHLYA